MYLSAVPYLRSTYVAKHMRERIRVDAPAVSGNASPVSSMKSTIRAGKSSGCLFIEESSCTPGPRAHGMSSNMSALFAVHCGTCRI